MLISPLTQDRWLVQPLLQVFLMNTLLVTLWANPSWRAGRGSFSASGCVSLVGSVLALAPLPVRVERLGRTAEIAPTMPLLALLAAGILHYIFRTRKLDHRRHLRDSHVYLLIALFFAHALPAAGRVGSGEFQPAARGMPPQRCRATCSISA